MPTTKKPTTKPTAKPTAKKATAKPTAKEATAKPAPTKPGKEPAADAATGASSSPERVKTPVPVVALADAGVVVLKRGKEGPIRRRHPWIFSGAIARVEGDPQSGDTVVIHSHDGEVLGRGAFSPTSQLRVRAWRFQDATSDDGDDGDAVIDADFIFERLRSACALRDRFVFSDVEGDETDGARLVFGEGDGLPGLIIDVYGDTAVLQCQSAGAERIKPLVVHWLVEERSKMPGARAITRVVDRGDAEVRQKEGLKSEKGVLVGELPSAPIITREHGLKLFVDVEGGHKTGFYLDQRDSRHIVRGVSRGARVLNCFCYTGGFSIAALAGGASHVTSVDTSMPALELGEKNAFENGFEEARHDWVQGDCFDVLKGMGQDGEQFDIVILDPPKFAPSAAHVERASRGYRELMTRGFHLVKPGGLLLSFSCSGAIDRALFTELASKAATSAKRSARILRELGHSQCHPVAVGFPEGEYLKGLMMLVD